VKKDKAASKQVCLEVSGI